MPVAASSPPPAADGAAPRGEGPGLDDAAVRSRSPRILGLFAFALLASPSAQARPVASLCRPGEAQTFSCPIGGKIVSVCGAGAGAVYRFGRPGKVEMKAHGATTAEIGYAGGGETQVSFANQDYRYVIYDRTVRTRFTPDGHHDPAFSQGLLLVKGGKVVADHACKGSGDFSLPSKALEGMAPGEAVEH